MRPRFGGLWLHADFRRLWAGMTISTWGTMAGNGALAYAAILELDAVAWQLAVLTMCTLAPGFLFGLFGGAIVDRFRRRPILIACDIGRFAILATVPLAFVLDVMTIWQLWAVAFLVTTLTDCLFNPAYEAHLPTLIPRTQLLEGNSKLAASANVAEFTGFSVSGWLVQLLRAPGAIAVNACTYLVSAFAFWRIQAPEPRSRPEGHDQHLLREIREGLRFVAGSGVLRSLAAGDVFLAMGSRMLSVVYLIYLNEEVGFSPGVLGMIFAVGGVSSLVASLFAGRITARSHFGTLMVLSLVLVPIGALGMPLAASVSLAGVTLLVANQLITDPGWMFWEITKVTTRQSVTPDHLMGRMNSTMRFLEFAAASTGAALGGILGTQVGARETLFVAVGVMALPALCILLSPVARLRTPPGTPLRPVA